jgi:hypothetical protein
MRAFFEALALFFRAMALLIPELIPLVRIKVRQAVIGEAEKQYGEHRKRFLEAMASGDPNRVAAALNLLDEQLLSRGVGIDELAAEHRADLPGEPGPAAGGHGVAQAGRSGDGDPAGDVARVGGVPRPDEQVAVGGDHAAGPVQLPELMDRLEGKLHGK